MTFPTVTNTSTGHVAIYRVMYREPLADACERLTELAARLESDRAELEAANKELQAALATAEALAIF